MPINVYFPHVIYVREGFFYDISLYPRVQKPDKAEGFIRLNKLNMGNEYRLNFPREISKDIGGNTNDKSSSIYIRISNRRASR